MERQRQARCGQEEARVVEDLLHDLPAGGPVAREGPIARSLRFRPRPRKPVRPELPRCASRAITRGNRILQPVTHAVLCEQSHGAVDARPIGRIVQPATDPRGVRQRQVAAAVALDQRPDHVVQPERPRKCSIAIFPTSRISAGCSSRSSASRNGWQSRTSAGEGRRSPWPRGAGPGEAARQRREIGLLTEVGFRKAGAHEPLLQDAAGRAPRSACRRTWERSPGAWPMTSTRARSGPCAIGAASLSNPASSQARQARMRARSAPILATSFMALWFHIVPAAVYGPIPHAPLSATISHDKSV